MATSELRSPVVAWSPGMPPCSFTGLSTDFPVVVWSPCVPPCSFPFPFPFLSIDSELATETRFTSMDARSPGPAWPSVIAPLGASEGSSLLSRFLLDSPVVVLSLAFSLCSFSAAAHSAAKDASNCASVWPAPTDIAPPDEGFGLLSWELPFLRSLPFLLFFSMPTPGKPGSSVSLPS